MTKFRSLRDSNQHQSIFTAASPKLEMAIVVYKSLLILGSAFAQGYYPQWAAIWVSFMLYMMLVDTFMVCPYNTPSRNVVKLSIRAVLFSFSVLQIACQFYPNNDHMGIPLVLSIPLSISLSYFAVKYRLKILDGMKSNLICDQRDIKSPTSLKRKSKVNSDINEEDDDEKHVDPSKIKYEVLHDWNVSCYISACFLLCICVS
jgi:hypothetical protein